MSHTTYLLGNTCHVCMTGKEGRPARKITKVNHPPWIFWGACKGSRVIGTALLLSTAGFSTSLMQHLDRSSATSAVVCIVLSEYNTHALHVQPQISRDSRKFQSKYIGEFVICQDKISATATEENRNFQKSSNKLSYLGNEACCLSGGATVPPLP